LASALIVGYVPLVGVIMAFIDKFSDLLEFNKGVNVYSNRHSSDIYKELENIKNGRDIKIFLFTLKQMYSWLDSHSIQKSILKIKPRITIYILNPDCLDEEIRDLCMYYSMDIKEFRDEMVHFYEQVCKQITYYSTKEVPIVMRKFDILKQGLTDSPPLPNFQYFQINDFVYFNPLITLHLTQNGIINGTTVALRPKEGIHIRFNTKVNEANIIRQDYDVALQYYVDNCLVDE
jgi:hypothetical protein